MTSKRIERAPTIRSMLTAGRYRLSVGRSAEVASLVCAHPKKANQLIECLWDEEVGVACRAANALDEVSRTRPSILASWKAPLLGLLTEATEKKLRWHLAVIVPRLELTRAECQRVAKILQSFLEDPSSIVKTCALQGLSDLTRQEPSLLPMVLDLVRIHGRSGTAAMRARSRHLLLLLEVSGSERECPLSGHAQSRKNAR